MKKLVSILVIAVMCLALSITAFAEVDILVTILGLVSSIVQAFTLL